MVAMWTTVLMNVLLSLPFARSQYNQTFSPEIDGFAAATMSSILTVDELKAGAVDDTKSDTSMGSSRSKNARLANSTASVPRTTTDSASRTTKERVENKPFRWKVSSSEGLEAQDISATNSRRSNRNFNQKNKTTLEKEAKKAMHSNFDAKRKQLTENKFRKRKSFQNDDKANAANRSDDTSLNTTAQILKKPLTTNKSFLTRSDSFSRPVKFHIARNSTFKKYLQREAKPTTIGDRNESAKKGTTAKRRNKSRNVNSERQNATTNQNTQVISKNKFPIVRNKVRILSRGRNIIIHDPNLNNSEILTILKDNNWNSRHRSPKSYVTPVHSNAVRSFVVPNETSPVRKHSTQRQVRLQSNYPLKNPRPSKGIHESTKDGVDLVGGEDLLSQATQQVVFMVPEGDLVGGEDQLSQATQQVVFMVPEDLATEAAAHLEAVEHQPDRAWQPSASDRHNGGYGLNSLYDKPSKKHSDKSLPVYHAGYSTKGDKPSPVYSSGQGYETGKGYVVRSGGHKSRHGSFAHDEKRGYVKDSDGNYKKLGSSYGGLALESGHASKPDDFKGFHQEYVLEDTGKSRGYFDEVEHIDYHHVFDHAGKFFDHGDAGKHKGRELKKDALHDIYGKKGHLLQGHKHKEENKHSSQHNDEKNYHGNEKYRKKTPKNDHSKHHQNYHHPNHHKEAAGHSKQVHKRPHKPPSSISDQLESGSLFPPWIDQQRKLIFGDNTLETHTKAPINQTPPSKTPLYLSPKSKIISTRPTKRKTAPTQPNSTKQTKVTSGSKGKITKGKSKAKSTSKSKESSEAKNRNNKSKVNKVKNVGEKKKSESSIKSARIQNDADQEFGLKVVQKNSNTNLPDKTKQSNAIKRASVSTKSEEKLKQNSSKGVDLDRPIPQPTLLVKEVLNTSDSSKNYTLKEAQSNKDADENANKSDSRQEEDNKSDAKPFHEKTINEEGKPVETYRFGYSPKAGEGQGNNDKKISKEKDYSESKKEHKEERTHGDNKKSEADDHSRKEDKSKQERNQDTDETEDQDYVTEQVYNEHTTEATQPESTKNEQTNDKENIETESDSDDSSTEEHQNDKAVEEEEGHHNNEENSDQAEEKEEDDEEDFIIHVPTGDEEEQATSTGLKLLPKHFAKLKPTHIEFEDFGDFSYKSHDVS